MHLGDARHVWRWRGATSAIWSVLALAIRCSNGVGRASEDPDMRLAAQIALDIVLAWLICLSVAVAVLVAIRMRGNRYLINALKYAPSWIDGA